MKQHIEPTPAIHAESLKAMLISQGRYDENEPDISISDLLSDIMHLVDANLSNNCECDNFTNICEWATNNYTAEVEELKQRQKGRRA